MLKAFQTLMGLFFRDEILIDHQAVLLLQEEKVAESLQKMIKRKHQEVVRSHLLLQQDKNSSQSNLMKLKSNLDNRIKIKKQIIRRF